MLHVSMAMPYMVVAEMASCCTGGNGIDKQVADMVRDEGGRLFEVS